MSDRETYSPSYGLVVGELVPLGSKRGLDAFINHRAIHRIDLEMIEITRSPSNITPDKFVLTSVPTIEQIDDFFSMLSSYPDAGMRNSIVFSYNAETGEGQLSS